MPCATADRATTPSTASSFLPGGTEDALLQDHGPSMSSGAVTEPPQMYQPAIRVCSISTSLPRHLSDNNKDGLSHKSTTTSSSRLPAMSAHVRLPAELWCMTLESFRDSKTQEDLTYLWLTVRHVSTLFRDEIEKLFMEEHMGKIWLHADCGKLSTFLSKSENVSVTRHSRLPRLIGSSFCVRS